MQAVSREMFGGATRRPLVDNQLAEIEIVDDASADQNSACGVMLRSVQKYYNDQRATGTRRLPIGRFTMPYQSNSRQ